jgi:hypothetical protein
MVSRELAKCKSDLVGAEVVGWDKGGTEPADDCTFFCGYGNVDHHLGTGVFGLSASEGLCSIKLVN